ncbi:hypothetical protein ACEPPN_010716 [Leptodophora sp. 'Broadleaf-Isolate-01']
MHRILFLIFTLATFVYAQTPTTTAEPSSTTPLRPIDTAFDVQPDSIPGGCSAAQKNDLSAAFDEMILMKNIISVATGDMSNNVEIPSVGWMFNYLFAIPSTQENHDHGDYRDNTQVDNLLKMWHLMDMIGQHSTGLILQDARGTSRKTRIYCNYGWIKRTKYVIDPTTDDYLKPRRLMNGGEHWYDKVTKIAMPKQTRPELRDPSKSICGAENLAVTHTHFNAITFCSLLWERGLRPSLTMYDPPHQLILLDSYQSFSKIFLHEYAHLVGRSYLGPNVPDVQSPDRGAESVGFYACNDLAMDGGAQLALENADSYAVLGVALFLKDCDWRDGSCQSGAYWDDMHERGEAR